MRSVRLATALLLAGCGTVPPPGNVQPAPGVAEPQPVEPGRAPYPGEYDLPFDVEAYDIELSLFEGVDTIAGRADVLVRQTASSDDLPLDLTGLAVHEVLIDGVPARFAAEAGKVWVPLDGGGREGRSFNVTVRYSGTPDDGLIIRRNVHGRPSAFADNWPNRARFWFPSIDHPSDKARVRFRVHAPSGWQVIGNGALQSGPPSTSPSSMGGAPDRRTWEWRSEVPIPTYTMVIGAADFDVRSLGRAACGQAPASPDPDACIEVTSWAFRPDADHAAQVFRRAPDMVDHFVSLFGPFPFEKLANVQAATRFGGMENASAIFYSEQALASRRDMEGTASHEIAHQWFGDWVTESDWHHLWLSEGFATYFGNQYFEVAEGPADFRRRMEEDRVQYVASGWADTPVLDTSEQDLFRLLNANHYQKGGWILHMLRGAMGDPAFFGAVRAFADRHGGGTALTDDFRRIVEDHAGADLGWFFEQWLTRPGHPIFEVHWSDGPTAAGSRIRVEQVQPEHWPAFRIPELVVELATSRGPVRHAVEITDRVHVFDVPGTGPVSGITLDPDGWILKEVR